MHPRVKRFLSRNDRKGGVGVGGGSREIYPCPAEYLSFRISAGRQSNQSLTHTLLYTAVMALVWKRQQWGCTYFTGALLMREICALWI